MGLFFESLHAEPEKYQPEISSHVLGNETQPDSFTVSMNVTDKFGEIKNSTLTYSMTNNKMHEKTVPMELVWGDRRNGSYIGTIDLQNRKPLYVNYTWSFIDDLGYENSNKSSFLTNFTDEDPPLVLTSNPEGADIVPLFPNSTRNIFVVSTIDANTIISATLADFVGSGVKNATISYTTNDSYRNFNNVRMQLVDPDKLGSRWNGKWRGEISNDRISPNSIVKYHIIACDYSGNCSGKSSRPTTYNYKMGMADKIYTDIKLNILEVDPFNLTIKTEPTITEHIDQNLKSDKDFEGIGIGSNYNSNDNVRWNSTQRRVLKAELLGEKSNYPFDSYNASIILAIPKKSGSELNERFSYNPIPILGANWNISALLKKVDGESLEKYCPEKLVYYVCEASSDHDSTFFRVDLAFNRNYTISSVIIPILAIFFLLGGIFIFESNSDNISNRLALTLSVFALIFSLPEIIKSLKPEITLGPSIADSLLSIIVIGAISYTISSVIGSKLDNKESKLDNKESKLDNKESKLDNKESKLDNKESKVKINLSKLKTREWWQKWLDMVVFVFVAFIVIGLFVIYPYSLQNKLLIGSIILVGLGYGLLFKKDLNILSRTHRVMSMFKSIGSKMNGRHKSIES